MTTLEQACDDLTLWLPRAAVLLAQPDTAPTSGHAAPGSAPPWNAAVANALFDALEGIRELEQSLRGRDRRPHAVTGRTLQSIQRLAHALPDDARQDIARQLTRYAILILRLPAVDQEERPRRIDATCPYCQLSMLRAYMRDGRVTCLRQGACFDADGRHPVGYMTRGEASGEPFIAWADGFIQIPPEGTS